MSDDPENMRREVLDRTVRTYDGYRSSGRSRLWARSTKGMARAVAERDDWISSAVGPAVHGTVVDLGCGSGGLAVLLDSKGLRPSRYLGVDLIDERLSAARIAAPWADFVQASADDIPLPDRGASAVVAMTLLSSVREPWFRKRITDEVSRVLAPGGRFVVYDLRYPSPGNRNVRPVTLDELERAFPGWEIGSRTLTLLPPLARSAIGAGKVRYSLLSSIPLLQSHIGFIAVRR